MKSLTPEHDGAKIQQRRVNWQNTESSISSSFTLLKYLPTKLWRTVNRQSCKLSVIIHTSLSKQTPINNYWDEPSKNAVSLEESWFFYEVCKSGRNFFKLYRRSDATLENDIPVISSLQKPFGFCRWLKCGSIYNVLT